MRVQVRSNRTEGRVIASGVTAVLGLALAFSGMTGRYRTLIYVVMY